MTEQSRSLVLLVDGSEADRRPIRELLVSQYRVAEASTMAVATQVLNSPEQVSLLITYHQLPDGNGLQMLDAALGFWPPIPVIFMIDPGDEKVAAEALKRGAADFIVKGGTPDLRLTQVLANALARSQAEILAKQRAREIGVLNVILTALNRESDEQPVLDTIVEEVHALMGTDACSIFLMDESVIEMSLRASTRLPVHEQAWKVPVVRSIAGRIVRQKQGEITPDVTKDPDFHSLDVDNLIPTPVRSMLTVPLINGTEVIGVLQAINKSVGPFLDTDLSLMESIAAVATAAIIRGRQFHQIQRMAGSQS
ncbi:MAG: GAF domain-containing protein [Chloroflexi bacterium]|nr:GAF domain-containing protein [Chloroflexota bacterium]